MGLTLEMKPQWYPESMIPYDQMWEDDRIWLPELLSSEDASVNYTFWFNKEMKIERYSKNETKADE